MTDISAPLWQFCVLFLATCSGQPSELKQNILRMFMLFFSVPFAAKSDQVFLPVCIPFGHCLVPYAFGIE
jgi:hypothetical protein